MGRLDRGAEVVRYVAVEGSTPPRNVGRCRRRTNPVDGVEDKREASSEALVGGLFRNTIELR